MSAPRRFKRYPAYKDSGVEWLREIPFHWTMVRVSEHAQLINGYPFDSARFTKGEGLPLVRIRDLESSETEVRYAGEPVDAARIKRGDILIGMDGEFNVGRWKGEEALLNQRMCCLRPRDSLNGQFLSYSVPYPLRMINDLTHSTTVKHLSSKDVKKINLPYPPRREQDTIAAFLDHETAKIDGLVARKERLIELLQEKRTALITHAVTRGLDPNVPIKDSGVEWLGEIPAHWSAPRMWTVSRVRSGGTPSKEEPTYWDGEIPWVTPKDMKRRFIDSAEDSITDRAVAETGMKLLTPPVMLIVVRGMILAHSFPVAVTTVPVTINQDMKAVDLDQSIDPKFMSWVIEGIGEEVRAAIVEEAAHGTKAIRMDEWRLVRVPAPDTAEQHAIAAFLDRETAEIDALVAKVREAVNRLKEFRAAMISAAVTGRIDVRGQQS